MKQQEEYNIAFNKHNTTVWCLIFFVVGIIIFLIPAFYLFDNLISNYNIFTFILFALSLSSGLIIHELLHGLGWVSFGKVHWKDLKFGILISKGILFIHSIAPLTMKSYRIGILLPGLILGFLIPLIGLLFAWPFLVFLGIFMFSVSAGDFIIFWKTRKVSNNTYIIDHPNKIGIESVESCEKMKRSMEDEMKDSDIKLLSLKSYLVKGFSYVILFSISFVALYYLGYFVGYIVGNIL